MQLKQDKMELEVTHEKQNPLVKRKEIKAFVKNDISPKKFDIAKVLGKKYSVPVDNIRVMAVYGKYGSKEFDVTANIYESKEDRDKIELFSKKEKEAEAKALEAENAPSEEEKKEKAAPAEETAPAEKEKKAKAKAKTKKKVKAKKKK